MLDYPNERSLHTRPTPRTGGLGIWAGSIVGLVIALQLTGGRAELAWMAAATLVVGVVSFFDDRSHLSAGTRLTWHLAAAALMMIGGLHMDSVELPGVELEISPMLGLIVSVLFIVWMTNLYNFMDGMDGFAPGMGLIGFGTFSFLGWWAGEVHFAYTSAVIAAATAGFLVFNFPPAKIFMGDTGSSTLGFSAGAFMLWAVHLDIFPLWIGVLVFSPFVVDATVTLVRRLIRGEKLWLAHKTHYYQRIVQLGWGHRKTVLAEYALMFACAVSGIAAAYLSPPAQWVLIIFWIALYAGIMSMVTRLEQTKTTIRHG